MNDNVLTDPFAAECSPREIPLAYPGHRPKQSTVITSDALWPILDRNGQDLAWSCDHVQRLPMCRVALEGEEAVSLGLARTVHPYLSSVLEESQGVSPNGRVPVLAIGSNAAPAQLRHKFRTSQSNTPLFVPSIRARVSGMRAAFCSFVSPLGYVPATMVQDERAETEMALQLLDEAQLRQIDASESTAYKRVWVETPILLETGELLPGAYAYVARHGSLGDGTGAWIMGVPGDALPSEVSESRWFPDQESLLSRLCAEPTLAEALGATPHEIIASGVDMETSFDALRSAGLVREDNPLFELPDEIGARPRRYGALFSPGVAEPTEDGVIATAGPSIDYLERRGRSVVRLGAEVDRLLDRPQNVELVSAELVCRVGESAPRVVATVLRGRDSGHQSPDAHAIEVDNVLRMGIGAETGERILVRAAGVRRSRWPDAILGPPNSLTMRVTLADPATTERDVCLMSALSLQLLGISSGDYVVLEGAVSSSGRVPTVAVKAFEVPDDIRLERQRVSSGTWGARFPGVRETLGIAPDIPLVFADASTRARLGIGRQELGTLRARPARLQQFGAELRETLILLAVALVGLLTVVPSAVIAFVFFGALVVGTFGLTLLKLRRRLSHPRARG